MSTEVLRPFVAPPDFRLNQNPATYGVAGIYPPSRNMTSRPSPTSGLPDSPQTTDPSPKPPGRPKQSKSRNGCSTCKQKRLKCDETKPACLQCQKRNVECGGYKKDFKWRAFGEADFSGSKASTSSSTNTPPSSRAELTSARPTQQDPIHHLAVASSLDHEFAQAARSIVGVGNISPGLQTTLYAVQAGPSDPSYPSSLPVAPFDRLPRYPLAIGSPSQYTTPSPLPSLRPESHNSTPTTEFQQVERIDPGYAAFPSSAVSAYVSPGTTSGKAPSDGMTSATSSFYTPDTFPTRPALAPHMWGSADSLEYNRHFPTHQPRQYTSHPGYPVPHLASEEDGVEEIPRLGPHSFENWNQRFDHLDYDVYPDHQPSSLEASVARPMHSLTSVEMLLKRYTTETCGILSVKDGQTENPWRTMIFPMIHEDLAVHHALSSMTAFHNSQGSTEMQRVGTYHFEQAITLLKERLGFLTEHRPDIAIAAIIILAFAESWDRHVSTGRTHLRGARAIIGSKFELRSSNAYKDPVVRKRINFLRNVWIYLDVLARLTPTTADRLDAPDQTLGDQYSPCPHADDSNVDPLLGCAASLFPLIARVANLANRVRNEETRMVDYRDDALKLQILLESWQPCVLNEEIEDTTNSCEDVRNTAEAYRWATLLLLHQSVPELPSLSNTVLAQKCLVNIAKVPLTSRMVIVHVWPLVSAGCESVSPRDRIWLRQRWDSMITRMNIGNVDKAYELVQEVWRRRDAYIRRYGPMNARLYELLPSPTTPVISPFRGQFGVPAGYQPSPFSQRPLPGTRSASVASTGSKRTFEQTDPASTSPTDDNPPCQKRVAVPSSREEQTTPSGSDQQFTVNVQSRQTTKTYRQIQPPTTCAYRSGEIRGPSGSVASSLSAPHRLVTTMPDASHSGPASASVEMLPRAYTVKGELHWLQVMADYHWEILLG